MCPLLGTRCWTWIGAKTKFGYGVAWMGGMTTSAQRVAWYIEKGEWPMHNACHVCDNPSCVRLTHLFDGDDIANMQDMKNKNRSLKGSNANSAKLTEVKVVEIRSKYNAGSTQRALAKEYGVTQPTIGYAVRGDTWKHIPLEEKK